MEPTRQSYMGNPGKFHESGCVEDGVYGEVLGTCNISPGTGRSLPSGNKPLTSPNLNMSSKAGVVVSYKNTGRLAQGGSSSGKPINGSKNNVSHGQSAASLLGRNSARDYRPDGAQISNDSLALSDYENCFATEKKCVDLLAQPTFPLAVNKPDRPVPALSSNQGSELPKGTGNRAKLPEPVTTPESPSPPGSPDSSLSCTASSSSLSSDASQQIVDGWPGAKSERWPEAKPNRWPNAQQGIWPEATPMRWPEAKQDRFPRAKHGGWPEAKPKQCPDGKPDRQPKAKQDTWPKVNSEKGAWDSHVKTRDNGNFKTSLSANPGLPSVQVTQENGQCLLTPGSEGLAGQQARSLPCSPRRVRRQSFLSIIGFEYLIGKPRAFGFSFAPGVGLLNISRIFAMCL